MPKLGSDADDELAIGLNSGSSGCGNVVALPIWSAILIVLSKSRIEIRVGNKCAVQTSIRIEPQTPISVRAVDEREHTAEQQLAIRLHDERRKGTLDSCVRIETDDSSARIETAVETAIRIKPGNSVSVRAVEGGEITPDEHLAIGL